MKLGQITIVRLLRGSFLLKDSAGQVECNLGNANFFRRTGLKGICYDKLLFLFLAVFSVKA